MDIPHEHPFCKGVVIPSILVHLFLNFIVSLSQLLRPCFEKNKSNSVCFDD